MHKLNMATWDTRKKVTFQFDDREARKVFLAGSFNGWNPSARPLKKDARGLWKTSLVLGRGIYQFRFVVDGEWKEDPSLRNNPIDGSLYFNSVIVV